MKLISTLEYEAVAKALYGDAWTFSKTEKKQGLSRSDKMLVAANVTSAGLGVAATNQLLKPASENFRGTATTGRAGEAGGLFRASLRGAANGSTRVMRMAPQGGTGRKVLKPVVRGTRLALKSADKTFGSGGGTKGKIIRGAVAGGIIGGTLFNASADAASARSISQKAKVEKSSRLVLVAKSSPDSADMMTPRGLKLKAVKRAESTVREQAPVIATRAKKSGKAAVDTWTAEAKVSKSMPDKRQVYGWASITELNGEPVIDLQGDYVTIDEIEKAAHEYVSKSRMGGDMHRRNGDAPHHVADLIESIVITPDKKEALGLPADSPTCWWVGFQVNDEDTWNLVKDGKRPMFSIHGSGKRVAREMA